MKRLLLLLALFGFCLPAHPQEPQAAASGSLESYLEKALSSNLVLQQRNLELSKAINSLEEARRLFLPTAAASAGFLSGVGGRYIDLPLGTLLNPAYGTLNQLTNSQSFPEIGNVAAYFLPKDQWDAKVRTSMALVNPDLYYNRAIQKENVRLKDYEVAIYKRELVKNIKTAYYNLLLADANTAVQTNARTLVQKQLYNVRKQVAAGSALPAQVHRADAEAQAVESQLAAATNTGANARNYFNFLVNQDLASPINTAGFEPDAALIAYSSQEAATAQREELNALGQAVSIYELQTKMRQAFWMPRLNTFLDLGNQSTGGLKYNNRSRYYLYGFSLDAPLFAWGTNKLKTQRATYDARMAQLDKQNTQQALTLSATNARNDVQTAKAQLASAKSQNAAANSYFTLTEKAFASGAAPFIDYLDARTQLTNSEIGLNAAKYRLLAAHATQERETATYALK